MQFWQARSSAGQPPRKTPWSLFFSAWEVTALWTHTAPCRPDREPQRSVSVAAAATQSTHFSSLPIILPRYCVDSAYISRLRLNHDLPSLCIVSFFLSPTSNWKRQPKSSCILQKALFYWQNSLTCQREINISCSSSSAVTSPKAQQKVFETMGQANSGNLFQHINEHSNKNPTGDNMTCRQTCSMFQVI